VLPKFVFFFIFCFCVCPFACFVFGFCFGSVFPYFLYFTCCFGLQEKTAARKQQQKDLSKKNERKVLVQGFSLSLALCGSLARSLSLDYALHFASDR